MLFRSCPPSARVGATTYFALSILATLWLLGAHWTDAHELSVDQLRLRPSSGHVPAPPTLRGAPGEQADPPLRAELMLRAEHDGLLDARRAQRLVDKATTGVEVLARSAVGTWSAVQLSWSVRELWQPGGAVGGDLLLGRGLLPTNSTALKVALHPPLANVSVLVTAPGGPRIGQIDGVLLHAGQSPPYLLASEARSPGWNKASEVMTPQASATAVQASTPSPRTHWLRTSGRFLRLGIEHVVPNGTDHALFVALLALGQIASLRSLAVEVSLFTLAHLLALIAMRQNWISTPGAWVEPAIALSIVLMAVDCYRQTASGLAKRHGCWRRVTIAGFGLWHGLGFAGSLATLPLADGQAVPALASFNLGVELGQLSVALVVWLLAKQVLRTEPAQKTVVRFIAVVGGLIGLWWMLARTCQVLNAA